MRKATIIVIALIYVASIVIVGIFGLNALVFTEKIYVEEISFCDNDGTPFTFCGVPIEKTSNGSGYQVTVVYDPISGASDFVNYEMKPDDATKRRAEVKIIYSTGKPDPETGEVDPCATLTEGLTGAIQVTFKRKGAVTLQFMAVDGSKVSTTLTITALG